MNPMRKTQPANGIRISNRESMNDDDGKPDASFPFSQAKERWSMWLLKKYGLPLLNRSGILKGRG